MVNLEYGKIKALVPGSWQELTPRQFANVILVMGKAKHSAVGQMGAVYYLLPKKFRPILDELSTVELHELKEQFAFLVEPPSFPNFIFGKLKKSWFGLFTYYGPTNSFGNLTVREYGRANFYLRQYAHALDADEPRANEYLNKFIGCLYFKKVKGERYVPLNSAKFDEYVKQHAIYFSDLPLAKKQAIAFNFSAVREYVFGQFTEAFRKTEEPTQSKADKYGWDGMVQQLAVARHIAPDVIYHMNLLEFLIQLDTLAIAHNEKPTQ